VRIGVFSDVHGHLVELKKTLALFKMLEVDEMVCAGDLIDKGTESGAVVDLMRERGILCVQGNHDAKVRFMWLTHLEPLDGEAIDYLVNLPTSLVFEWAGVSVYLSHANPWQDSSIYIHPTRPMILFDEVANSVEAKVIILGHTHYPMCVYVGDKVIVNPGSIYGNRDLDARTCGVLSLPDGIFDLYDIDTGAKITL
jgi:putative phosphoesterase